MDEENIVFRVTSLKSNGSVWTKQYNSIEELNQVVPILLEKFPHIVISKQVLKMNPVEYLISMGDRE